MNEVLLLVIFISEELELNCFNFPHFSSKSCSTFPLVITLSLLLPNQYRLGQFGDGLRSKFFFLAPALAFLTPYS